VAVGDAEVEFSFTFESSVIEPALLAALVPLSLRDMGAFWVAAAAAELPLANDVLMAQKALLEAMQVEARCKELVENALSVDTDAIRARKDAVAWLERVEVTIPLMQQRVDKYERQAATHAAAHEASLAAHDAHWRRVQVAVGDA
jgi:hypothetical protein